MAQGIVVAAQRHLQGTDGELGHGREHGLILAAELLQRQCRLPQSPVQVADDRQAPRHGQLARRAQEGVSDPGQQRRQALAGRQRRGIVPGVDGDHRLHQRQLGAGLHVQRAGGPELLNP